MSESVELKPEIIGESGRWLRYLGFAMLLQLIGFIVTGVLMVAELFGIVQAYQTGALTEEQFLRAAMDIVSKYIMIFLILVIIVAIIAVIAGIKLLPMKEYHVLFLISGILIIIAHLMQIAGSAYSLVWIKQLTAEEFVNISAAMAANPVASAGNYIILLAYLLLGIALYLFGGTYEEYEGVKTGAIIIIIGAILILFGIGYLLLMIGLIMAGGKLKS